MTTEKSSASCYTGLPPNFKGWVSEHVFGRRDTPDVQNKSYQTFKFTDGQYGLQETCREGTGETESPTDPWNNTIVAIGTFNHVVEKHMEYTGSTPWTITSPDGTLKDGTIELGEFDEFDDVQELKILNEAWIEAADHVMEAVKAYGAARENYMKESAKVIARRMITLKMALQEEDKGRHERAEQWRHEEHEITVTCSAFLTKIDSLNDTKWGFLEWKFADGRRLRR